MENYFNYFTEIEEHFQRARGSGTFRLSTLDWALIESWKESQIPLEAALRGIDCAFEKWHARARRSRMVNSLAYCAQEVMAAAHEEAPTADSRPSVAAPFTAEELAALFGRHATVLQPRFPELARSLDELRQAAESGIPLDLEEVERRLTVLEEKMFAALLTAASEQRLLALRRELESALRPYRRKLSGEQMTLLEKQFLRRELVEAAGLPRLSLFHW